MIEYGANRQSALFEPLGFGPMTPLKLHTIDRETCIKCDMCYVVCPVDSVRVTS